MKYSFSQLDSTLPAISGEKDVMPVHQDSLPIELIDDETVIRVLTGTFFRSHPEGGSFTILNGILILSDQRLVFFETFGRRIHVYPLCHIVQICPASIPLRTRQAMGYDVIRVEFDNGGGEYFGVDDPSEWIGMIEEAKKTAPHLDYSTIPSTKDGVEASKRFDGRISWAIAFAIVGLAVFVFTSFMVILLLTQGP